MSERNYYKVKYVRRPRISRAWGRNTKVHVLYLIFETSDEARAVFTWARRLAGLHDGVWFKDTGDPPTGVSVEDAQRGLSYWKEQSKGGQK